MLSSRFVFFIKVRNACWGLNEGCGRWKTTREILRGGDFQELLRSEKGLFAAAVQRLHFHRHTRFLVGAWSELEVLVFGKEVKGAERETGRERDHYE